MSISRNCFWLVVLLTGLAACTGKKKPSLSGEDPVEMADFIEFFPDARVPYQFADTTLTRKETDSLLISYKIFTQFVPDTVMHHLLGKNAKPKLYPMAKVKGSDGETYLFTKVIAADKRAGLLFAFDKKDRYMDGMKLLEVDKNAATQQAVSMDKSSTLYVTVNRKNADGTISDGREVYGLSKSNARFALIMTDALDDKLTELINPIDTFSRKFKHAADYGTGKLNLVSIRDGRKKDRLTFFIHFEKNKGECTGELKGEALIKSPNVAEYREGGDPCVLRFTFSNSAVTLKELEGCGVHRGLRCSFDGAFPKKREAKAVKSQK